MMKNFIREKIMMIIAIIVILVFIPLALMNGEKFQNLLIASGVHLNPNINDGFLIAEFEDPANDLLRKLPEDSVFIGAEKALDLIKFSIKKVSFSPLSGMGIESRLNLCFEFQGEQPNPFDLKNHFSFPVIHVYIKTPSDSSFYLHSNKSAKIQFSEDGWKYQVIIDGFHEQARIFDNSGSFIGKGIGLYINKQFEKTAEKNSIKKISSTKITAGIPIEIIGDPEKGLWKYYVAVGLLDLKNPSMFYSSPLDTITDVFDCILPKDEKTGTEFSVSKLKLSPIIIKN